MLITMTDNTDRPVVLRAILRIPPGMASTDALTAVNRVYQDAKAADPEEWNYSDLIQRLEALGFANQEFVKWNEV